MKKILKQLIIIWLITNQNCGMILNPAQLFREKNDHEYFNLMNPFLVSLVICFVGSQFKLLRMSWYKFMIPFWDHLHSVIKEYLCTFNDSFPGIDNISNEEPLSGMSKYITFSLTLMFFRFGSYLFC